MHLLVSCIRVCGVLADVDLQGFFLAEVFAYLEVSLFDDEFCWK